MHRDIIEERIEARALKRAAKEDLRERRRASLKTTSYRRTTVQHANTRTPPAQPAARTSSLELCDEVGMPDFDSGSRRHRLPGTKKLAEGDSGQPAKELGLMAQQQAEGAAAGATQQPGPGSAAGNNGAGRAGQGLRTHNSSESINICKGVVMNARTLGETLLAGGRPVREGIVLFFCTGSGLGRSGFKGPVQEARGAVGSQATAMSTTCLSR
jgi:hypothetical protein